MSDDAEVGVYIHDHSKLTATIEAVTGEEVDRAQHRDPAQLAVHERGQSQGDSSVTGTETTVK